MVKALEELCDGYIEEGGLKDGASTIFQSLFLFHSGPTYNETTCVVTGVTLTVSGDNNFYYEATLDVSSEEPVIIDGNIQFDDNHLINFFTIENSLRELPK
jgi:hypothetical protein